MTTTQKTNNLQEIFLTQARRERRPVTMFLMNGFQMRGCITGFDAFTVVLNSDGKLALITATTTGEGDAAKTTVTTTGLYGLAPDSIKADEEGPVWLTGEYFADSLALPEGVTIADVEVALRNIGIFLK